jgi:hypothetical protein
MSIVDYQNLTELLAQSKEELAEVQKRIKLLTGYVEELDDLHEKVLQLEAFQASLGHLLHLLKKPVELRQSHQSHPKPLAYLLDPSEPTFQTMLSPESSGVFLPELAFQQADAVLRHRQSMNYELFRAVVLNGGKASTAEVRAYLIEQNIRTPQGKTFENSKLSDVYPRLSYLVKRGVLRPIGPGYFLSCFGWDHPAFP